MVKFSVLIPTRNRLNYLKFAIESVLLQDYSNWEIIISDNCSDEDVEGYIHSLNNCKIKYFRTNSFISVTENWNNAIEKSDGDYVIMLGDDDGLMQSYFSTLLELLNQFDFPDFVYTSAFLFAYPNVLKEFPQGLLHKWGNAEFFEEKKQPFLLDKNLTLQMVKKSMGFKVLFNFNMQFALVSRSLIKEFQKNEKFYQSPYPDYYAMTSLFLKAKKILAVPYPLVIVGITPKSFGYYYFNQKEKEGLEFLNNYPDQSILNQIKPYMMPGANMNTSWLLALETVKKNFGREFNLKVNYQKYRFLQILHHFQSYMSADSVKLKEWWVLFKSLYLWEKVCYFVPCLLVFQGMRYLPKIKEKHFSSLQKKISNISHPSFTMERVLQDFKDISEINKSLSYKDF